MTDREILRHALAALAYRAGKTLRDTPEGFGSFGAGGGARTPLEILAHMGDLMAWALRHVASDGRWVPEPPTDWQSEAARFYGGLSELDAFLASDAPLRCEIGRVLQGPIADAFHHVGQLALLRRLAGAPVRAENYFVAEISAGRVGPEQAAPRREFD